MLKKKVIVIGSGVAGLSAASYLAKMGADVTVLEKNSTPGGRARKFETDGFMFDMGPSWYWMPDVFEKFYNDFGYSTKDLYDLKRLDPSYRVFGKDKQVVDIPAAMTALEDLFDSLEPGSGERLKKFLKEAAFKYETGMKDLVYKPGLSLGEFLDVRLLQGLLKMDVFTNMSKHVRQFVNHPLLTELLEFPVLFLGAMPQHTPALYSLMNYADMQLGTWYPMGGMHKIVEAFTRIATEQGAKIVCDSEVVKIETLGKTAKRVVTKGDCIYDADIVIGAGDYHHIEQQLLSAESRTYSESYWQKRKMAPSCLLYYVGVNKRLKNLCHHNLFFDTDFGVHAKEIYETPAWPKAPLFYVSAPSVTDKSVAPEGHENLFLLIPVAPGMEDTDEIRDHYFNVLMDRMEAQTGQEIRNHVIYKRSYAMRDFVSDYHAFKGNAYGLANTLTQTAILKPSMKSSKLNNLYYTGQLTVPGPGLPPGIISGEVVARLIEKEFKSI